MNLTGIIWMDFQSYAISNDLVVTFLNLFVLNYSI